tara:strand:- start:3209 stop:3826 length:618 start_codon:yes stop_codon:yes gene_type:complete
MELEKIYFIYSQYCNHCKKFVKQLPQLQQNYINTICIDNKLFRERLLNNKLYKINYVPSIIIILNNKVTIYEGIDATKFLNDKLNSFRKQTNKHTQLEKNYKQKTNQLQYQVDKNKELSLVIENYKYQIEQQKETIDSLKQSNHNPPQEYYTPQEHHHPPSNSSQQMRTSIDDLLYDSEEESGMNIPEQKQSLQDIAQKLQEGRH